MSTGLVYLRPVRVVAVRTRGPYGKSAQDAWSRLLAWLEQHRVRDNVVRGFGLAHDDPRLIPAEELRYDACVEVPLEIETLAMREFSMLTLPGGAYARHRFVGPHSGIHTAFREMRESWAPSLGLALHSKRPFVEIYLDDPARCAPERLRTDLCIPVIAASEADAA